ncbi:MAG: hypothetical protein ABIV28_01930 [Longimicrobiales bacterium]
MNVKIAITAAVAVLGITACGGKDAGQSTTADDGMSAANSAATAAGVPSAEAVAAAQKAGNHDTGGSLTADISGGKTGHADINDIGFCVMATAGMKVFALSGNNAAWAVSISGMEGLPSVGTHKVEAGNMEALTFSVIDKSSGSDAAQNEHYEAESGSVTFTKVTDTVVEGTFTVHATPSVPVKTGPAVDAVGRFSAPHTSACD